MGIKPNQPDAFLPDRDSEKLPESAEGNGEGKGEEGRERLAAGWTAATDDATGKTYYYNDKSESSWERPS